MVASQEKSVNPAKRLSMLTMRSFSRSTRYLDRDRAAGAFIFWVDLSAPIARHADRGSASRAAPYAGWIRFGRR
jgi:hypothetical protein